MTKTWPSIEGGYKLQARLARLDGSERNAVEGKFGEGKRKYGLGLIRARLQETSETVVALQFLIMNLEHKLRILFWPFFNLFYYSGMLETRKNLVFDPFSKP